MPEIAEVETVRRTLINKILNKKIDSVEILYPEMIKSNIEEFKNNLINQKFIDIKRIGKWLIFETDDYYLMSHLRMEGKYYIKKSIEPINKHEHVIIHFKDNIDLRYHDTRKFGIMNLINKDELYNQKEIIKQGYEVSADKLTVPYLKKKLSKKRLAIKTCLLDQTIISGLGNIYADEVLFASKINPLKKGNELNNDELNNIIISSDRIITRAIELGGTTIKSYTSSLGVTGKFQQELKVHKKEGKPCSVCGNTIIKIKVNGRGTYYCPSCQKKY